VQIVRIETFLTNAGLRNYLFLRLTTDTGVVGLGEASLEWQEPAVRALIHDWAEARVLGADPFAIEAVIGGMIRDQYQGGATVMTAISGIEIALWDIIGRVCGQPVYKLLGGRCHDTLLAYANGWYGGADTPEEFSARTKAVLARGYRALKLDPFGTAWKELTPADMQKVEAIVSAVRAAAGPEVAIMIEGHGRLSAASAIEIGRRLIPCAPAWFEEPVSPHSPELLCRVKTALPYRIAAGERAYTLAELAHLIRLGAVDVLQMDPAHCGGLLVAKKAAAIAEAQDVLVSPHCSIGPVALCAALHLDWATPNVMIQENFSEFDVPWRDELVYGWNPLRGGEFLLPEGPGLGIDLNLDACAQHPYQPHSFPSLWDERWQRDFTQNEVQA
jgi:galactonate dehydratase